MRKILKVASLLFILFIIVPPVSHGANFTIPQGAFSFNENGVLVDSSGNVRTGFLDDILKSKQSTVIQDMMRKGESDYKDTFVEGDLITSNGVSLWSTNLSDLKNNTTGTTFTMKQGSTVVNIYVPPGLDRAKPINRAVIAQTIIGIEKYQDAIREAVMAGSLAKSVNIYTMYPSQKQVPLTDIIEDEMKDGVRTGFKTIKSSHVTMNYTLDAFYNPLFGKIDSTDIKRGTDAQKFWESKIYDVKLSPSSDAKNVNFEINSEYTAFTTTNKSGQSSLSLIDSKVVQKTDGVKSYRTTKSKTDVQPHSMIDGAMQLIVPYTFQEDVDRPGTFQIDKEKGYKIIDKVKLHITHLGVYGEEVEGGGVKRLGSFEDFGINIDSLVVYSITVGKNGTHDEKGKKVGAVIPTWFKETVVDVTETEGTDNKDAKYYTGRTVKFANDYTGKISLDGNNADLFAVDSKRGGKQGIQLRRFAFPVESDYKSKEYHTEVPLKAKTFEVNITFENYGEDLKGFFMYRNNAYINEPDLITWLDSPEAKAMADVKSDKLLGLITGRFTIEQKPLTYEEWLRMQEIKKEMDTSLKSKVISFTRVLSIIFGFLLIIYSIFLVLAYWFDIVNVLFETSILNIMTNKRLYPISTRDELEYIATSQGDVKYVTFWNVLFLFSCGVAIGLVFLYVTPLIELVLFLYYKILSWTGAI